MMQTFRISDALLCILLNAPRGPNFACPRVSLSITTNGWSPAHLPRNARLWTETLVQRQDRVTVVWWDGIRFGGLASAGSRAGSRVWEVDHLYLPTTPTLLHPNGQWIYCEQEVPYLELLERLVQLAGGRNAERVFLRLRSGNPVIALARRVGFFPYFEETLLEGKSSGGQASCYGQIAQISPINNLRKSADERAPADSPGDRRPEDDYGLFQLFSASTPARVRAALGLTFDQWKDARERHGHGRREWVARTNDKIVGWLSLVTRQHIEHGELMAHPNHPEVLPALMGLALAGGGRQRWLVPDYQESVGDLLRGQGFQEAARYAMLIKTVAAQVKSHGMVPLEA